MPRVIPGTSRSGANSSERRVYNAFEGIMDRPDWIVFHSLPIRQHIGKEMGEADFVVVVPGKGIVVIETKSPKQVDCVDGVWTLDRTPQPHKNPFTQVDGALGSIRAYLRREGAISGDEPFARLVWFTSIGRHHFSGRAPSDLSFFEWELAWADDVSHPARAIERVLEKHAAWHSEHLDWAETPESLTQERTQGIVSAMLRDFSIEADLRDVLRETRQLEAEIMAEQRFALELVQSNRAVYFDGPAGCGKSYLLSRAAFDSVQRGERTLMTCWNIEIAKRHRAKLTIQGPLAVMDLGTVMLKAAGLAEHPEGATGAWYQEELPKLALAKLEEEKRAASDGSVGSDAGAGARGSKPAPPRTPGPPGGRWAQVGGYQNVVVDEFQDIAGNPLLMDVVLALVAPGGHLMFAGDKHQQIMRPVAEQVDPFSVAKIRIPDLVHAQIRRNCRQAPALVRGAQDILGKRLGFHSYRLPQNTPGGAERIEVAKGGEVAALAKTLRQLTKEFGNAGVVVLSPHAKQSLAARVVSGELDESGARTEDLRWLRSNLGSGEGLVRYSSISKLKGIETDAVVVTDAGTEAAEWAAEHDLNWEDLLYVALSRAKYRAVVLG